MIPARTFAIGDSTYVLAIDYNALMQEVPKERDKWIETRTKLILARLVQALRKDDVPTEKVIATAKSAAEREWHEQHDEYPELL